MRHARESVRTAVSAARRATLIAAIFLLAACGHGAASGPASAKVLAAARPQALPARLPASRGRTYFVSPKGSDAARGSRVRPWRTIQYALSRVGPGQAVAVRAGVYHENVVMTRSGTPQAPITLRAYRNERPVLEPAESQPSYPIKLQDVSYVRVRGFVIENAVGASITDVYVSGTSHDVEIAGCEIRGSQQHGIFTDRTTAAVQMLGNTIHDNGSVTDAKQDHGIYVEGRDQVIANNVIYNQPHGWGIQLYPADEGVLITANTIVGNELGGIVVGGNSRTTANHSVIVNNVVAFNKAYGVRGYYPSAGGAPGEGNVAYNNIAFGNRSGNFANDRAPSLVVDFGGGNLEADPLFISLDRGDFHLNKTSPALGRALRDLMPRDDHDGRARDVRPDLGAFERP